MSERRIGISFDVDSQALQDLEKAIKTIDNFNRNMDKLKKSAGSISSAFDTMSRSQEKMKQKQQDLNNMMSKFDGVMKAQDSTVRNLERSQRALSDQLQKYGRDIKVSMNETGKFTATMTNFDNQVVKVSGTFNEVTGQVDKFQRSVMTSNNAMKQQIEKMKEVKRVAELMKGTDISNRLPQGRDWNAETDSLIRYGKVISGSIDRNNKFTQTIVTQQGEVRKITGYYNKGRNALIQYNEQVSKANKTQLTQAGFNNDAIQRIGLMSDSMKGLNKYTLSWNEAMAISATRMVQWGVAGTVIFGMQNAFQSMIATIVELDTQMTSLRRVLDDDVNMEKLFDGAILNAETLGRKLTEINESMIEFGRQGFNEDQIQTLVKATGMLSNVADMDMTKASENITAYLATFRKGVDDVGSYVDRLNEVDNKYAVSVDQLSDSVRKAGGTANAFGVSIDTLIGHTTAIGEATRESGNVIGNSLKTIYSRVTTVAGASRALDEVGISVKTMAGESRNAEDIFAELSLVWDDLTKAQRENIGVQVAGRYQLNRFLIMMQNYDKAMQASETATKSWGSASRENQKYMESLQAKINRLWTALQLLSKELGDAGVAKAFGAILEISITLINGLTKLTDTLGAFTFALPVLGAGLIATIMNFNKLKTSTDILKAGLITVNPAITTMGTRLGMSTANATIFAGAVGKVTTSLRTMALATVANPLFWIPIAIGAIVGLIGHYDNLKKRQEELSKSTKTGKEEYQDFLNAINSGTVDTYQLEKYKEQIENLKEAQKDLGTIVVDNSSKMTNHDYAMSRTGISVDKLSKSKEALNKQYADETTAMSVLNDEQENMLAQMGLAITSETTVKNLKADITARQKEYTASIKEAEKAMQEAREKAVMPSAEAYYSLGQAIDENATAMENAIGITDKLMSQMKEQRGLIELLSGVKNKDSVQTDLLNNAYAYWADMLGVTEEELKKHPALMDKQIEKHGELLEISGKLADGTATNEERRRAQKLLSAENAEKTSKRESNVAENTSKVVRDAYELKQKKLYEYEKAMDGSTKNNKNALESESKKAEESASRTKKSNDSKASSTNSSTKKTKDYLQQEIDKMNLNGRYWGTMADDASSANSKVSSTTKTSKDNTVSNLQTIINKISDLKIGWGDLATLFSNPIAGIAKLSIKAVFGGLFGSGGNLNGDKIKDAVMKSGGGSISGQGYGGLRATSGFGYRIHPITGKRKFHAGMDLAGPMGTPIRARQGGTVISSGWAGGYGNMVTILGTDGLEYRYAHNSANHVRAGQFVPAGMNIASMGSTGNSTGPHLHFEVRRGGQAINPKPYYHSGGIVDGKPKRNEVDARLQVGEMVINQNQQKTLFDFLNKKNGNDTFTGMGGPTNDYRVRRGDTFSELAEKYYGNAFNGGMDKLKKLNPSIRNINRLFEGQTIKVPNSNYKAPSASKPKPKPTPSKPRYANADQANNFLSSKGEWFDQVETLGIRAGDYRVRHMVRPEYREAYKVAGKEREYTNGVISELKEFTNYNQAKKLFDQANVFLNSADKAKALKVVLQQIGENALAQINDKTTAWLDKFNNGVKEANASVLGLIDISQQIDNRKSQEKMDNFTSNYSSSILKQLGVVDEVDPLTSMQQRADEVMSLMQSRADESALIQYRLNSQLLDPRLKELENYRSQLQNQINAVSSDFRGRGITDSSLINEAQKPLKDRLAEITAEYNELQNAISNSNTTLADNKAELEKLASEYKDLQNQIENSNKKREFTDVWGNIVRDAEGGVKMVTDQGQLIMNTYEQVKKEMEKVKNLASSGSGLSAVISPIIDQLANAVQAYAPTIDTTVAPGTAIVNNSATSETRTYEANTNVNRNVTYVVQAGVALASESELKEFAMLIKDMIEEEEGRSK